MQNGVELIRKLSVEIMAHALRSRKIDDANCPLQTRLPQERRGFFLSAERKQEIRNSGLVEERLITPRQRWSNMFAFGGSFPTPMLQSPCRYTL